MLHRRYIKSGLALITGLFALVLVLQNLMNMEAAHSALHYVVSNQEHNYYPNSLFPTINSTAVSWALIYFVCCMELAAGLITVFGGLVLFKNARYKVEAFESSAKWAEIGCFLVLVVWYGLFMVGGGAVFQMWQTELGAGSFGDAFKIATLALLSLLYISKPELNVQSKHF